MACRFPGVVIDGAVSRTELSKRVVGNPGALKQLEAIVHPLVKAARDDFLARMNDECKPLAVLDIPLLYENQLQHICDEVLVVSAPAHIQRARVLARPAMQALPEVEAVAKYEAILAKQMPDEQKRVQQGVVVIDTSATIEETRLAVSAFVTSRKEGLCPEGPD